MQDYSRHEIRSFQTPKFEVIEHNITDYSASEGISHRNPFVSIKFYDVTFFEHLNLRECAELGALLCEVARGDTHHLIEERVL